MGSIGFGFLISILVPVRYALASWTWYKYGIVIVLKGLRLEDIMFG